MLSELLLMAGTEIQQLDGTQWIQWIQYRYHYLVVTTITQWIL